ncbi:GguC protein [Devosia oryziradicis]|uniref:GguC protein n=1 Tax=Devosia oryziradicis TaxID=2801335 RepID=A0ABX7BT15_9HYPH|nr:AraD1 family protein [Devosia oryziradicis]QQR34693.1 GguC protein [Devosia oryziradicis]
MNLIQFFDHNGARAVGAVDNGVTRVVNGATSVYELAMAALSRQGGLGALVADQGLGATLDREAILAEGRMLAPIDHPDPAHLYLTGTGLTHLGSAATRDAMHTANSGAAETGLTDTMKMFRMGLEGGKPADGLKGVQPEWFYKGNGYSVVNPGHPIPSPGFALDAGEEPEIAGVYLIDQNGQPRRLGFALANEFSDHVTERINYLYLAHSKLRACAFGPELRIGDLPAHIEGKSRIWRDGKVLWEKPFLSGEDNMSHTIANLEYHHFKYDLFRRPGDVHVHMFGTATLSFADGIKTQPNDIFEIEEAQFGAPLRNPVRTETEHPVIVGNLY